MVQRRASIEYRYVKFESSSDATINALNIHFEGKKWLQRRKILTPAFHFSILEEYVECFDTQSSILVDKLSKYKPNEKIEFYPLITLCALDIICETTMGTSLNAQSTDSAYAKAVRE